MKTLATNLGGVVETPELSGDPYRIDRDGRPYVGIGDGGIVLGVRLGDSVFATDADHAAPGACLVHPDQTARHALVSFACLGNTVTVRTGAAAGARGVVLGKRGELGRVIACFEPDVLAQLAPNDAVVIHGHGQGLQLPDAAHAAGVAVRNIDPSAISLLPVEVSANGCVGVSVRARIPSKTIGNGIGRPTEQWDLDLSIDEQVAASLGLADLVLGDLVAVDDLDIRHNAGYRKDFVTVGIIVHGSSPQPGHGPGLMPLFCGPSAAFALDMSEHTGVTEAALLAYPTA